MKLLCLVMGHKWSGCDVHMMVVYCVRCGKINKPHLDRPKHEPVSTLDDIVHSDWYLPRKKRHEDHRHNRE